MTFQIEVENSDIAFPCEAGETVLDAAERAGLAIPYSCRKGVCSTCEGGIGAGSAKVRGKGPVEGPARDVLLCQCLPTSDLTIQPRRIGRAAPPERKIVEATVHKLSRPRPDVAIVHLRFPSGQRAKFRAGQYLRVLMEDGDSRNFSMANPPSRNDGVELHIRHLTGGRFSETVLAKLDKGSKLRLELPYGEFFLTEGADAPAILLATGTGFAPLKSIVEDQIQQRGARPLTLYWGGRHEEDLYAADLARKWADRHDWFRFVPVLTQPDATWSGRTGWVQNAAREDHPDLSAYEVYACGSPTMTSAAQALLTAGGGLPAAGFHQDAFVASGGEPESAPA